jgi:hypothetical protein
LVLDDGTSDGSASSILQVRFVPQTQTDGVKRGLGASSGETCFCGTRPAFDVGESVRLQFSAILYALGGERSIEMVSRV